MSHLLDDDDDDLRGHQNHRELTLSTGTVIGIFLGLALSWALFFGFGYHMGSKVRADAQPTAAETPDPASTANFNSFKPAPGSPASSGSQPSPVPANSGSGPVQTIAPGAASHLNTTTPDDSTAATEKPAPISLHPAQPVAPPPPVSATGTFVVQVAAVSHQEDADLLVGALHGKGYSVSAHSGPDNLVHIQVGPFNSRKEAESMRQQLLSDGYNAIVK
jgi:cell division septation protein DedD